MLYWMRLHSLWTLLAAASLFTFLWLFFHRKKLRANPFWLLVLTVLCVAYGMFSVKAFAAVESLSLSGFRNMSLFGTVFFMPPAFYLGAKLTKRPVSLVFDVFTVPMVFTLMCARISCLFTGCCYGVEIPGTHLRWPTREAELVYYVIILAWFFYQSGKPSSAGWLYPIYMISYGAIRFVLEFFRFSVSGRGLMHLSHFWALLSITIGICVCLELMHKTAGPSQRHHRSNGHRNSANGNHKR